MCFYLLEIIEGNVAGNMADTGQDNGRVALLEGLARCSPSIGSTQLDLGSIIVLGVDDTRVFGLTSELLECATTGTSILSVHLDHVTTEEGSNPIGGTFCLGCTTLDTDVGTGVVDGEGTGWDGLGVVASDLGPEESVFTILHPGGELELLADTLLGLTGVKAVAVALAGVALGLDDVLVGVQSNLGLIIETALDAVNNSDLDESTIVVVPPPFDRNLLPALEDVFARDLGVFRLANRGVLIGVSVVTLFTWLRLEHVRVGVCRGDEDGSGEEESRDHLVVRN